jgi:hypothetical protein
VVPPRSNHQKASLILAYFFKQNKGVNLVFWYQMAKRGLSGLYYPKMMPA